MGARRVSAPQGRARITARRDRRGNLRHFFRAGDGPGPPARCAFLGVESCHKPRAPVARSKPAQRGSRSASARLRSFYRRLRHGRPESGKSASRYATVGRAQRRTDSPLGQEHRRRAPRLARRDRGQHQAVRARPTGLHKPCPEDRIAAFDLPAQAEGTKADKNRCRVLSVQEASQRLAIVVLSRLGYAGIRCPIKAVVRPRICVKRESIDGPAA